jgi:hypothetical protein
MVRGKEIDGTPSLRYITLLRNGARAHGLPARKKSLLGDFGPKDGLGRSPVGRDVDVFADPSAGDGVEDCRKSTHSQRLGRRRRAGKGSRSARELAGHRHCDPAQLSRGRRARRLSQVGQLFRERGLRTAVSGYCYSSCSRMFLGGATRYFTDDYLPDNNNVGFHGHYDRMGRLNANLVRQHGLRDWIIKYSDGKADPVLVERWINIPYSHGMIHFFHPGLVKHSGVAAYRPSCARATSHRPRYLPASRLARQHLILGSSRRWTSCTALIAEAAK